MSPAEAIERHAAAIQKGECLPRSRKKLPGIENYTRPPAIFLAGPEGIDPPTRSLPATPMSL